MLVGPRDIGLRFPAGYRRPHTYHCRDLNGRAYTYINAIYLAYANCRPERLHPGPGHCNPGPHSPSYRFAGKAFVHSNCPSVVAAHADFASTPVAIRRSGH